MPLRPIQQTDAQKIVWQHLQDRRLNGWEFHRQHEIDGVVVDFYCPEIRLAIELDSALHALRPHEADQRRRVLAANDVHVLRFALEAVGQDVGMVRDEIAQVCFELTGQMHAPQLG